MARECTNLDIVPDQSQVAMAVRRMLRELAILRRLLRVSMASYAEKQRIATENKGGASNAR